MREYTSPGQVEVDPADSAIVALLARAVGHADVTAFAYRDGDRYVDVTTGEFAHTILELAAGLVALGIEPDSRIAIFSSTRSEFTQVQYAAWAAGCAVVTIYETSSPEQVNWIVGDSDAVAVFVENDQLKSVFDEVAAALPGCRHVFVLEGGGLDGVKAAANDKARAEVEKRIAQISQNDIALLIYTSGTTGRPKGCVLTQHNVIWDARQVISALPDLFAPGSSNLMFLPLAHSFAQAVQVACITGGTQIGYSTGTEHLIEELDMFKPTWVFAVPRVFEKVYNAAKHKADSDGKGRIFDIGVKVAIDESRQREYGKVSPKTRALHGVFDKLLYAKLRNVFGGRLEYAISGGAALGERLGHFYRGIGLTVLEGYGLTETMAATFVNRPQSVKIGTVGRPVPGISVRIANDGEVLIKGASMFAGYWNNETATTEAFDSDGWFRSGDIGGLDDDGFLSITGRKKELIVTAAGKNVAPAPLEAAITAHPLVSQCMVIGDARPFISALVTLDEEALLQWAAERGLNTYSPDFLQKPDLVEEIQNTLDEANRSVSRAESIRAFRILEEDFAIETGELTPTFKVKRNVIGRKYAHVIDEIYAE